MRARGVVAFATALIAVLLVGIWLGGHPGKLPTFVRKGFVDSSAGLAAEATELIQDNYYRPVGKTELGNSSLQGMVRGCANATTTASPTTSRRKAWPASTSRSKVASPGSGSPSPKSSAGCAPSVSSTARRRPGLGSKAGDVIVSVDGDSIAGDSSEVATAKIKGPEGTEVTVGVLDAKTGKVRKLRLTRAQVSLPITTSRVKTVDGRKLGYVRMLSFSEGVHAALRRSRRKGRARRRRKGSCSTCAATAAACSRRRS